MGIVVVEFKHKDASVYVTRKYYGENKSEWLSQKKCHWGRPRWMESHLKSVVGDNWGKYLLNKITFTTVPPDILSTEDLVTEVLFEGNN